MKPHFKTIENDLKSLKAFIFKRIKIYFSDSDEVVLPDFLELLNSDIYSNFLAHYKLSEDERLVLIMAICNEISPHIFDPFLSKNSLYDVIYTEFGGISGEKTFTPTIQSALFLLCGINNELRLEKLAIFLESATLFKHSILESASETKLLNAPLKLSKSTMHKLLSNSTEDYDVAKDFPAQLLKSEFEWKDLVFSKYTKDHLNELTIWLSHHEELLEDWGMKKTIKKGYKALFYGPPGTGKSLTAALLGKKLNKSVYRIDLSQIISKYIGETEKNLEKVFVLAEEQDWVLFFDEADSLFGKRTQVSSSNDRHANQGTSYLLQRIDECNNMIILASNLKDNFDEAYLRRFQSIIYFALPEKKERLELWKNGFSQKASLSSLDLESISHEYELSGATIMNVIRYASLMAIKRKSSEIFQEDIIKGIRREKFKEGKII